MPTVLDYSAILVNTWPTLETENTSKICTKSLQMTNGNRREIIKVGKSLLYDVLPYPKYHCCNVFLLLLVLSLIIIYEVQYRH